MGDVPLPSTVSAVRACVARFTVDSVAPRDLLGLGEAHLAAGQPVLADAAFRRWLGIGTKWPVRERAWALARIVKAYSTTTGQMSAALRYVHQLDALGDSAAPERLLAYLTIVDRAQFADSIPLLDLAVTGAMTASRALSGDVAKEYAPSSAAAYLALADLYGRRHDATRAIETIRTARATLVPLRPSLQRSLSGAESPYLLYGKPAPVVQASEWFGGDGVMAKRPTPGKPTLLMFGLPTCGDGCYAGYAVLRRLVSRYAAMGIQVTLVTKTLGHYGDALLTPDSEATVIAHYYFRELTLPPFTLAVWNTVTNKNAKDGRLMPATNPNEAAYRPNFTEPLPTVLIDGQGIVQCVTAMSSRNEALLAHQLQALLYPGHSVSPITQTR
jgi:hypothetical protein